MAQINSSPPFSIDEAQQRGNDVFELFYGNWGFETLGVGKPSRWPSFLDPGVSTSLAAVAIGPRSLVDRCWLTYNLYKAGVIPSTSLDSKPAIPTERVRGVSLDAPLILSVPSNPNVKSTLVNPTYAMFQMNPLYFWSSDIQNGDAGFPVQNPVADGLVNSTTYPATYTDALGNAQTLGLINGFNDFVEPFLHLYLYLKAPVIPPPTKRLPLMCGNDIVGLWPMGTNQLVAQIATFGRKTMHILVNCSSTTYSVRIGALRVPPSPIGITRAAVLNVLEEPVDASDAAVPGNTPVVLSFCNEGGVYADYINIYITTSDNNTNVSYRFSAYD